MGKPTVKKNIRFNSGQKEFHAELKARIDNYFEVNKLSRNGNLKSYLNTFAILTIYLVPYFLLVFGVFEEKSMWLLMAALIGVGVAGLGMGVMHDAVHGSYSDNDNVNKIVGHGSMILLSASTLNWKIQHNLLHHTYTNVHEVDEDIAPPGVLRFEPHAERKGIHKLQFLYAWFFYCLMTIMWSTVKDFKQIRRYHKMGLLRGRKTSFNSKKNTSYGLELGVIIATKAFYFGYMLLPFFLIPEMTFWNWLAGFTLMHALAGLIMASVFQLAHVVPQNEYPLPNEKGHMEDEWAVHQLKTTMNFALGNKLIGWYVGGLNHQVEHHLFPHISHVHYPALAPIVEQTALEYGVPYNKKKTLVQAIWEHEKMLWQLGRV